MAAAKPTIAVPLHTRDNRRIAERYVAGMPANVNGAPATTQDLSDTGLSFVTDRSYALGERVDVMIEYLLDGHNYPLQCQAEVVRVQAGADGYTVGARLLPQAPAITVGLPPQPQAGG